MERGWIPWKLPCAEELWFCVDIRDLSAPRGGLSQAWEAPKSWGLSHTHCWKSFVVEPVAP